MKLKPDWSAARENFTKWWAGKGLAVWISAPRRDVDASALPPPPPDEVPNSARWSDPVRRRIVSERGLARQCYLAETFPIYNTDTGPGSLGAFLGAAPQFERRTVWYEPCIADPDSYGPIKLSTKNNRWLDVQLAMIDEGVRSSDGRWLVGMPDLVENLDTLAAMRGSENLLMDLIERPGWVSDRLAEINEAYFQAFDILYNRIRDEHGGNAYGIFLIYGPGKMAKVQCDFSCMISPAMFNEFVLPHLKAQCDWLDYPMYHLDGTTAMQHLDSLLSIDSLKAIEWTPQAGQPQGGNKQWYDLYRRIKAGGKSVQAVGVLPDEVVPLIEAVGPEGLYILTKADSQDQAERLVQTIERYRK